MSHPDSFAVVRYFVLRGSLSGLTVVTRTGVVETFRRDDTSVFLECGRVCGVSRSVGFLLWEVLVPRTVSETKELSWQFRLFCMCSLYYFTLTSWFHR